MTEKVSVIVPTYNYGKYITFAIDSVLKQTYQNIEVIVVDDGSTDDTKVRLETYEQRIRYFFQDNKGASAARNKGLAEATGKYITFLDADDFYHPENIEKKVSFLQQQPDFLWCYSNWAWVDEGGSEVMYGHEPEVSLAHLKASGDVLALALQGYRLGTNVFMFRRELAEKLQGFDSELHVLEDYDYYLRAAAISPLGFVDDVLCYIYQHPDSLGTGCDKSVAYLNRLRLHKKIIRMFAADLKKSGTKPSWALQQADLYRNLAGLMLGKGHVYRAGVLLKASLKYKAWQLGALKLWLKILLAKVI